MAEIWEVYDEEGNPTGKTYDRSMPLFWEPGNYHLGADVWIINDENKVLIQKRSPQKRLEPNVWAMTGGTVIYGEIPIETVARESSEELDIDIPKDQLKLVTKFKTGNVWIMAFILKKNYDISQMTFQADEVSEVKWATIEEIDEIFERGDFIKNRWEFIRKFIKQEIESNK